MSFKKKDLEIVYSLRWKNGSKNADKESIIAVYDIPATTLNFEVFKSYLLKNSGTAEDDVKVSYIMDNSKEYPIQSQTDFQVALYAFRRKARSGEIINLMLERISDQPNYKNLRHSNDVETQFGSNANEQTSIVSTCCNNEAPPDWFLSCINQLKKEISEEITATISSVVTTALTNVKPQLLGQPPCHHHSRKNKPEKRIRKITPHLMETTADMAKHVVKREVHQVKKKIDQISTKISKHKHSAKDLIKSLKLDNKLDKLERKASKYREKRLALHNAGKSSDSEAGHSSSRSRSRDKEDRSEPKMDAKPVNCQSVIPHMLGGEIYLHQWEVMNTGEAPWTSKTHLQYTWGSKAMEPLNKVVSVPFLKPGDKGVIAVRLQIPTESGKYECYYQFMHKGRRFGHWLGCQVIVDQFDLKGNRSVLETSITSGFCFSPPKHVLEMQRRDEENRVRGAAAAAAAVIPDEAITFKNFEEFLRSNPTTLEQTSETATEVLASLYKLQPNQTDPLDHVKHLTEKLVRDVSQRIEELNLDPTDTNSDSDNQSVLSLDGSSSSKNSFRDEFVVVPVPKCFYVEKGSKLNLKNDEILKGSGSSTPSVSGLEKKNNFDDNNNGENGSGSSGSLARVRDVDVENMVVITVPKDEQVKEGFIYVHVDGQKVLVPKNILKNEVVNAAQVLEKYNSSTGVLVSQNDEVPTKQSPAQSQEVLVPVAAPKPDNAAPETDGNTVDGGAPASNYFEASNYLSHCSAAGSCFSDVNSTNERNNRLFIFPQDCPGYEVVYPVLDVENPDEPVLNQFNNPQATNVQSTAPPADHPLAQPSGNPFFDPSHVPNFQQTPPEQRTAPSPPIEATPCDAGVVMGGENVPRGVEAAEMGGACEAPPQVHILPESLVNGAVNAASSAFNTARSVINMIRPQSPGRWINGHWVSAGPETPREANLQALAEMGFWNRDLNATLLSRYDDDLNRVVADLVQ